MTQFLGANAGTIPSTAVVRPNDERIAMRSYCWGDLDMPAQKNQWRPGVLWSGSRFTGGGGGFDGPFQDDMDGITSAWEVPLRMTGNQSQGLFTGFSKDSTGANLGNCSIQLFVTSSDLFVGQVTSDASGYFAIYSHYTVAHYIVAYKAGAPDITGATVNTLLPTWSQNP